MSHASSSQHPASIAVLVDGTSAEQDDWFDVAASLSPDTLKQIEVQAHQLIDERFPYDPGSLLNLRFLEGKARKQELQARFDQAHDLLLADMLTQVEAVRTTALAHHHDMVDLTLYAQRRVLQRTRTADELDTNIAHRLAYDTDLQRTVVLEDRVHHRQMEASKLANKLERKRLKVVAKLERKRLQVVATLDRLRRELDQPHELHLKLYDVLQALLKFQMSLNDRAMRNPGLADRLQMMSSSLIAVITSVQNLIDDLNEQGEHQPNEEQVRAQSEQILNLAMEQMQEWQKAIQQEPDLASA